MGKKRKGSRSEGKMGTERRKRGGKKRKGRGKWEREGKGEGKGRDGMEENREGKWCEAKENCRKP